MENYHWIYEYVAPYINFLIFLGILVYFSRKPLANFAQNRKASFEAHFKTANDSLHEAQHELEAIQKRFAGLDEEIRVLKAKAKADAEADATKIVNEGKRLAAQILEDAKRMQEGEFLEAKKQLEAEALALAKTTLVERLQKEFDENRDRAFIEGQIHELGKITRVSEGSRR